MSCQYPEIVFDKLPNVRLKNVSIYIVYESKYIYVREFEEIKHKYIIPITISFHKFNCNKITKYAT